jgi:hypothetical protein
VASALAGPAGSSRSVALIIAGGVLGAIAGVWWFDFGPKLWGWEVLPTLVGGFVLAALVALVRRTAPRSPQGEGG